MDKKKVLEILSDLKPYWELSEWMIALIEAWFMDKETYQNTYIMIATAIKKMPEWIDKDRLKKEFEEIKNNGKASEKSQKSKTE